MKDLFGNEIPNQPHVKKPGQANGYAARPGTGPAGETCKTCANAWRKTTYRHAYWKCGLTKCTCGYGSDIRLKSPACQFWKQKTK